MNGNDELDDDMFVVNHHDGLHIIHRLGCGTIRHQIEGTIREEYPRWNLREVEGNPGIWFPR
ncbi:MAG: hypothetical protein AYW82_03670 [Bifidobacterium dentium]|nr:MAG: hypothetical protein AYW82_03670 [Bifidobacterium dentium]